MDKYSLSPILNVILDVQNNNYVSHSYQLIIQRRGHYTPNFYIKKMNW